MRHWFLLSGFFWFFVGCHLSGLNPEGQDEVDAELRRALALGRGLKLPQPTPSVTTPAPKEKRPTQVEQASESPGRKKMTVSPKSTPSSTPSSRKLAQVEPSRRPLLEDAEGFDGRLPFENPFRQREKLLYQVTYFGAPAGTLELRTEPWVDVEGLPHYRFVIGLKTSRLFSFFYTVDDEAYTLVDAHDLVPRAFHLKIEETGQVGAAGALFNKESLEAVFWEKKRARWKGKVDRRIEWDMEAYAQNVYSAVFYMRTFQLHPGANYRFRVAHEGQNLIFEGDVLREEEIDTKLGRRLARVVQPRFTINGMFAPTGNITIWVSADEKKIPLKIEAAIKIGSLIGELIEYSPGQPFPELVRYD